MAEAVYRDPTFDAVVRAEISEKKGCGVCVRRIEIMGNCLCDSNKRWPQCRREKKGFEYDERI